MLIITYIPGVWDLLHVGHLQILERAKSLGDKLVVGVPSDEVVKEDKGEYPIITLDQRIYMLKSLRFVDVVIPYYHLEFLTHLNLICPDILAVGETWGQEQRHKHANQWVEDNNKRMVRLPYDASISTSKIKRTIKLMG